MKSDRIYLASPHLSGKEMQFIKQALDSNWVAPLGENVDMFEKEVASYVGVKHAAALVSGTAAIHLALKWLNVRDNEYVFCSSLTFSGSCNGILYERGTPVFIDSEYQSWNMCPDALERAFEWAKSQNKPPKAVIVVNLYGQSADYDNIRAICERENTPIIEDAAESLGATYKGKQTGSFGELSALSFNGNKIITTSGGGMLLSQNGQAIAKARFWASQSRDAFPYYHHTELGYNYRLSNICAGIGRGQLSALEERLAQKKQIYMRYKQALAGLPLRLMPVPQWSEPNYWLTAATIEKGCGVTPHAIIQKLAEHNIEARHIWKPMHLQPIFAGCPFFSRDKEIVCEDIFLRGLCLPCDTKMTPEEQDMVIEEVKGCFNNV
ncbi:MAG: DegT/DnrJ/EryC1/StrS family aminotransferase [Christensenellales bacterium]|jgi:pyridoxal phosphate-dependent aminotransferase EpsN